MSRVTQDFRDRIEKLACNGNYRIVPLEVDYLYEMCNQIDLEYEKLSELIHGLTVCADDEADARTDCPFYDENEPNKCTINRSLDECHMFIDDNFNETEGTGDVWIECDMCGWQMSFEPRMPDFNYCPNCGRKVVY